MKSIIRQILKEVAEESQQLQSCKSEQTTNEFLKGFSMWRTGMCNEDTFNKKNQDDYQKRIEMCVSPYVGERINPENVCNEILNEYNKPEIRRAFNRYMEFPSGCYVFNIESCDEYKPMKSKEFSQLPNNQKTTLAKSTTTFKIPEPPQDQTRIQQIINKIIKQIKNKFGN